MRRIINSLKKENGIAVIEAILIMCLIGLIVVVLSPMFKNFLIGTEDSPGFAVNLIKNQTAGVDDSNDVVSLEENCSTNGLSDVDKQRLEIMCQVASQ